MSDEPEFAEDLLRGASEISVFLFRDAAKRRKVYHLASRSKMPTFKLGSMLCARRSGSSEMGRRARAASLTDPLDWHKIVRFGNGLQSGNAVLDSNSVLEHNGNIPAA